MFMRRLPQETPAGSTTHKQGSYHGIHKQHLQYAWTAKGKATPEPVRREWSARPLPPWLASPVNCLPPGSTPRLDKAWASRREMRMTILQGMFEAHGSQLRRTCGVCTRWVRRPRQGSTSQMDRSSRRSKWMKGEHEREGKEGQAGEGAKGLRAAHRFGACSGNGGDDPRYRTANL